MKKKFYIALSFVFMVVFKLSAQEYNTNESILSQLKNNKVPGAQYAPATVNNNTAPNKGFEGSSLGKALREGKVDGLKFITSPFPANPANTNTIKPSGLASDMSVSEAKAAQDKLVKETPLNAIPAPNLTQETKKE
jgi:hypothetical protein